MGDFDGSGGWATENGVVDRKEVSFRKGRDVHLVFKFYRDVHLVLSDFCRRWRRREGDRNEVGRKERVVFRVVSLGLFPGLGKVCESVVISDRYQVLDRQACEKFSGPSPSHAVEDLVSSITTKSTESGFLFLGGAVLAEGGVAAVTAARAKVRWLEEIGVNPELCKLGDFRFGRAEGDDAS